MSKSMAQQVNWPKIMLFGDSLTQYSFGVEGCWGSLIADTFQRKADILNRGFSGYNTRSCLEVLPYISNECSNLSAVTIFLGANDASDLDFNPVQAVPREEYKINLSKIIQHFKSHGVKNIFVITPPALNAPAWEEYCRAEAKPVGGKANNLTALYAESCLEVAKNEKVNQIDLHSEMLKQSEWKSLLMDGLHLSTAGSKLLASMVIPSLVKSVSSNLTTIFPDWKEVDNQNCQSSLKSWMENNNN